MDPRKQRTDETGTRVDAAVSAWIVERLVLVGLVVVALGVADWLVRELVR